jgi:hypothetical protein
MALYPSRKVPFAKHTGRSGRRTAASRRRVDVMDLCLSSVIVPCLCITYWFLYSGVPFIPEKVSSSGDTSSLPETFPRNVFLWTGAHPHLVRS